MDPRERKQDDEAPEMDESPGLTGGGYPLLLRELDERRVPQIHDPRWLARLLCLGGERRGENREHEGDGQPTHSDVPIAPSIAWPWAADSWS